MYTGTDPNLIDLQAQITALGTRLNSIDGVGLALQTDGVIPQMQRTDGGIRMDLNQSVLKLESLLNTLMSQVSILSQQLQAHLSGR